MKKIEAIIKHFKIDDVQQALLELGVSGMTLTEVRGFGRQDGQTEIYRGTEHTIDFVPKLKVEVAVREELLEPAIRAILSAARTGSIGDGKIFVSELHTVVRVRTCETEDESSPAAS